MKDTIKYYLYFFSILSTVVLIHESGHLLFALLFNFPVVSFNIGFASTLLTFNLFDINWNLRIIPLGGYVSLTKDFDLNSVPLYQITLFSLGGVLFNLFTILFITKFKLFDIKAVFINAIKFNFSYFIDKYSFVQSIMLFLSSILFLLNILPIAPLDGSKIIVCLLHFFDISQNIIDGYLIAGLVIFFFIIIYLNSPDRIRHFFNDKLNIDIGKDGYNYNFKHIKIHSKLLKLYENNYYIYQDNHNRLNTSIKEFNDNLESDFSLKLKEELLNKKTVLYRQEECLRNILTILDIHEEEIENMRYNEDKEIK